MLLQDYEPTHYGNITYNSDGTKISYYVTIGEKSTVFQMKTRSFGTKGCKVVLCNPTYLSILYLVLLQCLDS